MDGLLIFFPYFFINTGIRDIELYESVGYFARNRIDIYYIDADHRLWPYLPFLNPVLGILFEISQQTRLHFLNLWRLTTLITLLLTAEVMRRILVKCKGKDIFKKLSLFIFSPISLFPVVFHAHHDVILLFFYLLSILLLMYTKNGTVPGAISLGVSILAKNWSIVFLPLLLLQKGLVKLSLALVISTFTIVSIVYIYTIGWHSLLNRIIDAATGYAGSWVVDWGPIGIITSIINKQNLFSSDFRLVYSFLIFFLVYLLFFKFRPNILKGSEIIMLSFFVFTVSWAPQYLFWIWPFIVASERLNTIRVFSLLSLPYIFITYADLVWNLNLTIFSILLSLPIWLFGLKLWYDNFIRNLLSR